MALTNKREVILGITMFIIFAGGMSIPAIIYEYNQPDCYYEITDLSTGKIYYTVSYYEDYRKSGVSFYVCKEKITIVNYKIKKLEGGYHVK